MANPFVFETKEAPFYFDQFVVFSNDSYAVKLKSQFSEIENVKKLDPMVLKKINNETWVFLNVPQNEMQQFLKRKNKYSKIDIIQKILFAKAIAGEFSCTHNFNRESTAFLGAIQNKCSESGIMEKLQTCAADAFAKAGQNIVDDVKSVTHALAHPIEFFTDLKKQILGLGDFIRLLPETLKELKNIAAGISEGMLQMLACQAVGDLALPAIKMILGGAGSAALTITIKNWMESLKGMKHLLSGLGRAEKAGRVDPELIEYILKGGLSCEMAH